jgi:hypothetical protein
VGKGALAPCPPFLLDPNRWARFALSYCVIIFVVCMLRGSSRNKGIVAGF